MRDGWDYLILWTLISAGAIGTVSAAWFFRYRNSDDQAGTFTPLDVVTGLAGLALLAAAVVLTLTGTW